MNVNCKVPSVLLLYFITRKKKNFFLVSSSLTAQTGFPWILVYYSSPKRRRRTTPISQSSDMDSRVIFPQQHSKLQIILRSCLQILSESEFELNLVLYTDRDTTLVCKHNITLCTLLVEITKTHQWLTSDDQFARNEPSTLSSHLSQATKKDLVPGTQAQWVQYLLQPQSKPFTFWVPLPSAPTAPLAFLGQDHEHHLH